MITDEERQYLARVGIMNGIPFDTLKDLYSSETSVLILNHFLHNGNYTHKYVMSQNKGLPAEILDELSMEKDWAILLNVVKHPNTSFETLLRLSFSGEDCVRTAATRRLKEMLSVDEDRHDAGSSVF